MSGRDGGPAFPSGESYDTRDLMGGVSEHRKGPFYAGMTLRDYFAGQALAGITGAGVDAEGSWHPATAATLAYEIADAMLAARTNQEATR
jgi:hypothetical protein